MGFIVYSFWLNLRHVKRRAENFLLESDNKKP